MTALDAGRLRSRLEYEAPVETPDGQGGLVRLWQKQFDVWARIRPTGAAAAEEAGTRRVVATHEIALRWRDGIAAGARFRLGDRLFLIAAVYDPDETCRYLACLCREEK